MADIKKKLPRRTGKKARNGKTARYWGSKERMRQKFRRMLKSNGPIFTYNFAMSLGIENISILASLENTGQANAFRTRERATLAMKLRGKVKK